MEESEFIFNQAKEILFTPFLTKNDYKRGRELLWYAHHLGNANAAFMISQAFRFGMWRFPKRISSCLRFLGNAADRGHEIALAYLKYIHDDPDYRDKVLSIEGKYVQALILNDRSKTVHLLKDYYEQTGDVFALMELYYQSLGGYAVSKELVKYNHKAALFWFFKRTDQTVDVKYLAAWYEHIDVYEQQDGTTLEVDEAVRLQSYFQMQKQWKRVVKVVLLTDKWMQSYFELFFTLGPDRPSQAVFFIYWKAIVKRKFSLMPSDDKQKREHVKKVHEYYKACITNAKKSTLAWLLYAKRLGVCKDVARLIGRRIWRSRKEPDYWIWKEPTTLSNKRQK
jgi:hypothetical protein